MRKAILVALVSSPLFLSGCLFKKAADACDDYCASMEIACPSVFPDPEDDDGFDDDRCYQECDKFQSRPNASTASGNTLECRVYHANFAVETGDPSHCGHASPDGANVCTDFTNPTCKELCEGDGDFEGLGERCLDEFPPLDDEEGIPLVQLGSSRCAALCSSLPSGNPDAGGDSQQCRLAAAKRASEAGDFGNLCDQAREESPTCN